MSAETTSSGLPGPGTAQIERARPERAPGALRILAFTAVGFGLAALAAATFILSYSGIHALALQAGIAPRLARGYPLLIDAMLVIVLAAVLALRGADLPSKIFAWVTLLAVLAAAAGADALHAAGHKLPDHVAAITAAVLPWALVFLAFALLLTMLRHARLRRLGASRGRRPNGQLTSAAAIVPGMDMPGWDQVPTAAPLAATGSSTPRQPEPDLAVDADAAPDEAGPDEAELDEAGPDEAELDEAGPDEAELDETAPDETAPDETGAAGPDGDPPDDPDMPVFHRMWSAPTPPESPA